LFVSAIAAVLCAAAIVPFVAAAGPPVKVAVIVGPVGEATARYLARAEAAAKEAERWTSDVVRVYTPNATWAAARRAMHGASIVIYFGHGNGWPSQYRSSLFGRTQNGLGLNPVGGVDDVAHQYFGETYIARDVRLASGAIVLLHHLCYASGTSEPGLPEGSLDVARQRVDNYSAGFIRAGAAAVVAETGMGPRDYVRALLGRHRSIETAWRGAPTANRNIVSFASARTPGFVSFLDPRTPQGGYERSLVLRDDVSYAALVAGAQGRVGGGGWSMADRRSLPAVARRRRRSTRPGRRHGPQTHAGADAARRRPRAGSAARVRWSPLDAPAAGASDPSGRAREPDANAVRGSSSSRCRPVGRGVARARPEVEAARHRARCEPRCPASS
jgi:hypothetical protein